MIEKCILWVFLSVGAIWDFRKRSVPMGYLYVFGILGVVYSVLCLVWGKSVWEIIWGIVPGCISIMLSFVTREQIGLGDGLVILCTGFFLNGREVMYVVFMSLMILTVVSILLLSCAKVNRKSRIPFLPFWLAGYLVCILGGFL